jgi:hypothetical protein
MMVLPASARPELVEGLLFSSAPRFKQVQGFDKLSPIGLGKAVI